MYKTFAIAALLSLCATGCAVTFYDSAPAAPGTRYVVGSKVNDAVVFLCPEKPGSGECELVDVEVKE